MTTMIDDRHQESLDDYSLDLRLDLLFTRIARLRPDAPALIGDHQVTSYAELDRLADRCAAGLRRRGVGPGDIVPMALPRSVILIALMLATSKLGAAYAVIDPGWPDGRLRSVLGKMSAPLLIATAGLVLPDPRPVWAADALPEIGDVVPEGAAVVDATAVDSSAPVCVLFTSGTTGEAKCIITPHRAISRLFVPDALISFGPGCVVPQLAPLQWDASMLEIWSALLTGGALVLVDDPFLTPAGLRGLIQRDGVSTLWITSSLFNTLVDLDVSAFAGVVQVMTGGERLSVPHVRAFLLAHPDIALINGYGPAEATVFTTTHRLRLEDCDLAEGVPVGRPVPHTGVMILDGDHPARPGDAGEVCVSGIGLADGYLHDMTETARRFVPITVAGSSVRVYRTGDRARLDENGVLHYLGRMDRQLKIRGRRVEPASIEHVLVQVPVVAQVAVVARRDSAGRYEALAVVYTTGDGRPAEAELVQAADQALAGYEQPDVYLHRTAMPLTANNKIDIRQLEREVSARPPQHNGSGPGKDVGAGTLGAVLAAFATVLGLVPVEVDPEESLQRLGGSSISAIRVCALLQHQGWAWLDVAEVISSSGATDLAARLDEREPADAGPADDQRSTGSPVPLSGMQQSFLLANLTDPVDLSGHCLLAWLVEGPVDLEALERALGDMVMRHESLRAVYQFDDEPVAEIPQGVVTTIPLVAVEGSAELSTAAEHLRAALSRPFDLERALLMHGAYAQLDADRLLIGLSVSHIAFDGWSESVFLRDLSWAYAARRGGQAPEFGSPAPGLAHLAAGRRAALGRANVVAARTYWVKQLAGLPDIAFGRGAGRTARPLLEQGFTLTREEVGRLQALADQADVTLFTVLLGSYGRALAAVTGSSDFGVGVPMAHRDAASIDSAVSCLIDTVCLRLRPQPWSPGSAAALARTVTESFAANAVSFNEVVRLLSPLRTGRAPLYQTLFTYQNTVSAGLELSGLSTSAVPLPHVGIPTELLTEVWPQDGALRYVFTAQCSAVGEFELAKIVAAQRIDLAALTALADQTAVASARYSGNE